MRLNLKYNVFVYDNLMRLYFDKKLTTWSKLASAFNAKEPKLKSFKSHFLGESTGLFRYKELQVPNGFYILRDNAVSKSYDLTREIVSDNRSRKMVQVFDELSDTLCKVADMAEFVRIGHPEEKFTSAAEGASVCISTLVEELNTNRDLYDKLKYVIENGDVCPTDDIDNFVAKLFLLDFEQCGIHLDKVKRDQVVSYNEYILQVGSHFMAQTVSPRTVRKTQLPKNVVDCFPAEGETVVVSSLYADSKNELLREAAYKIFLHPERNQQSLLDELLKTRQKLAKLCGFPSYAHRAVRGSLAGTPEFVNEFLKLLSDKIKPKAEEDYKKMLKLKQEKNRQASSLMPWDVPYFMTKLKEKEFNIQSKDYKPYLSLGACVDGLNYIFNVLYNVNLSIVETEEGELWHGEVKKLKVSEGDETLGYIYCDFFERSKKPNQDCHFTIQGGRVSNNGEYQKPVVVLMLNLPKPTWSFPSLLTHSLVDNLFHEMGHAMHSMLARTKYQHVTGTRCSTDLAEIPSVLMEYFASDPRVVTKFARHYETGEVIPEHLVSRLRGAKRIFSACETELQIFYAAFDQACHNNQYPDLSTTELLAHIQKLYYGLPHVPDTAWQLRFGHLVGYGAKYYSYLVSRAVASWIWHKYFKDDPFHSENGKKFQTEILAYGGSRPPRELVENFLGTDLTPENLSDALMKDITCKYV